MDFASIAVIVTAVLALASALFSKRYYRVTSRVKVLAELLETASQALEDDQITPGELEKIKNLVNQLVGKE